MSFIGVHHNFTLDDFQKTPIPGTVLCPHCGRLIETGLINLCDHMENCPDHPVTINSGFNWKKMAPKYTDMKYSEWLKKKNCSCGGNCQCK